MDVEVKKELVDDVVEDEGLLIPADSYLAAGIHIGTQYKTAHMMKYIYRVRNDGLYILDIKATDERIRIAAKFLARYDPEGILAVAARQYGHKPATVFAEKIGAHAITGRYIPGTLTNPIHQNYMEPDIVVVTDPMGDSQVIKEAVNVGIPVIAMCDTNNMIANIELVIPTNNKGRKALATIYWLLTRETLKEYGREEEAERCKIEEFEAEVF
ncbi:MAG TPA: 30S ribosomal protein S2 [Candidatus Syntrophoarchaeum butanivorans]|nr:MAG: 30S ribosomal protein S2 [Candidatus Syntrophoarchaeum sp. WYZ-LMO15]HDM35787.1 30S ribosomal protein S2 [Candidatus Syntrophoarchaeum butanivorans]HEC56342.1 30S ribosomal protein S2 [Candidatus Syntrophoarchaeum butanivorans]